MSDQLKGLTFNVVLLVLGVLLFLGGLGVKFPLGDGLQIEEGLPRNLLLFVGAVFVSVALFQEVRSSRYTKPEAGEGTKVSGTEDRSKVAVAGRTKPQSAQELPESHRTRVRVISDNRDLKETLMSIVKDAEGILAVAGSRSRDADYLSLIEDTLEKKPDLVFYRVLCGQPRWNVLQHHLLQLLAIRNPRVRVRGHKTLSIGLFDDFVHEPEHSICATPSRALIVLPSLRGVEQYDTAAEFMWPADANGYVRFVSDLYGRSTKIESEAEIRALTPLNEREI